MRKKQNGRVSRTKADAKCKPVTKDFDGLREMLFEEINLLRAGRVSNSRARIVSNLAKRIIEAATLDLFAQRMLADGNSKELKRLMSNNVQG